MKLAVSVALLLAAAIASAQSWPGIAPAGPGLPGTSPHPMEPAGAWNATSILGKVQIADGTPLDAPVKIERVCAGVVHAEGYTDLKGNFSISLGTQDSGMPDASQISGPDTRLGADPGGLALANCELRASLTGYRSDVISLANRRSLDDPNVGTIFLHRMANVEGLTISATTALAPKDAKKAYEKALEALRKKKIDDAQKQLEKAVAIYPRFAAAWYQLGLLYEDRKDEDQASHAYRQSLEADSRYLRPCERLYVIAYNAGKWQEAADLSDRLLRLDPADYPEAYYFNAVANLRLNRLDAAEKSAREAVKLDTAHRDAKSYYTLGYILAQKGNYAEAAQNWRVYLAIEPDGKQAGQVRKDLADVERAAQARH